MEVRYWHGGGPTPGRGGVFFLFSTYTFFGDVDQNVKRPLPATCWEVRSSTLRESRSVLQEIVLNIALESSIEFCLSICTVSFCRGQAIALYEKSIKRVSAQGALVLLKRFSGIQYRSLEMAIFYAIKMLIRRLSWWRIVFCFLSNDVQKSAGFQTNSEFTIFFILVDQYSEEHDLKILLSLAIAAH